MLLMTEATKQAHAELRKNHPWAEEAIEKMGVAMDLFAAAAQVNIRAATRLRRNRWSSCRCWVSA